SMLRANSELPRAPHRERSSKAFPRQAPGRDDPHHLPVHRALLCDVHMRFLTPTGRVDPAPPVHWRWAMESTSGERPRGVVGGAAVARSAGPGLRAHAAADGSHRERTRMSPSRSLGNVVALALLAACATGGPSIAVNDYQEPPEAPQSGYVIQ